MRLPTAGQTSAAAEGGCIKVTKNCTCQPMVGNTRTWPCISYYSHPYIYWLYLLVPLRNHSMLTDIMMASRCSLKWSVNSTSPAYCCRNHWQSLVLMRIHVMTWLLKWPSSAPICASAGLTIQWVMPRSSADYASLNSLHTMAPEGLLPQSQASDTCSNPEPD
jgi:hypothetical protein